MGLHLVTSGLAGATRRAGLLFLVLAVLALAGGVGVALAAPDATVAVLVQTASADPIEGAFVALVNETDPTQTRGGVTGADGTATFAGIESTHTWLARATAAGFATGATATFSPPGGSTTNQTISLTSSGRSFTYLGAFGAQVAQILPDGRSGTFYANTTGIPSLYRTADYGGTWAPVTGSSDDATSGIDDTSTVSNLTTSGVAGEVAGVVGAAIWYSRDFGTTWTSFSLPPGSGIGTLAWAHAAGPASASLLFYVENGSTAIHYRNMPGGSGTVDATWQTMAASYKATAGDLVAFAPGNGHPFVAIGNPATGAVTLYRVDDTPANTDPNLGVGSPIPVGSTRLVYGGWFSTTSGAATPGPTIGGTVAPNTLLAYAFNAGTPALSNATMTSFDGAASVTTMFNQFRNQGNDGPDAGGSFAGGPNSCGATSPVPAMAISPRGQFATLGQCWLQQNTLFLVIRPTGGINNNTGYAFDRGYNGTVATPGDRFPTGSNLVALSGDGQYGVVKSARVAAPGNTDGDLNRPEFNTAWTGTLAAGGTASTSGGIAINGLPVPVVKDTIYHPTDPNQLLVGLSFSGGGRTLFSLDGGTTLHTLFPVGSGGVAWWPQATSTSRWLAGGAGGDGNWLRALETTTGSPLTAGSTIGPAIANTARGDFGLVGPDASDAVGALAGVSGTNRVLVGTRRDSGGTSGSVALTTLVAGTPVTVTGTTVLAGPGVPGTPDKRVAAMAYCPAGSAPSVADTAIVAYLASTEGGADGGLYRITSVSGAATFEPVALATGDYHEVRVECTGGTIWAGRYAGGSNPGLQRSPDGGTTFIGVPIPLSRPFNNVEALAFNPAAASELLVVSREGDMALTADGGGTWTLTNDTTSPAGRRFGGERVADVEIPPPASSGGSGLSAAAMARPAAVGSNQALVASGAGLFSASVRGSQSGGCTPPCTAVPVVFKQSAGGW